MHSILNLFHVQISFPSKLFLKASTSEIHGFALVTASTQSNFQESHHDPLVTSHDYAASDSSKAYTDSDPTVTTETQMPTEPTIPTMPQTPTVPTVPTKPTKCCRLGSSMSLLKGPPAG